VKEYPSTADIAAEAAALDLSAYARRCGIPTPRVLTTKGGCLIAVEAGLVVAVFEYIEESTSWGSLSLTQMQAAGKVLGEIHRHFREMTPSRPAETPLWLRFDLTRKLTEVGHYLEIIERKAEPDQFDRATHRHLTRKREMLKLVPELLSNLPPLTTQVLHGDYGPPNLLFQGSTLTAVLDFGPPTPFLLSYELGRIALNPEDIVSPDGMRKAEALVAAYLAENDIGSEDARLAPRMWLVQLIRSTYGVKQHYLEPHELQEDLDTFFLLRAQVADRLLRSLLDLEMTFTRLWEEAR
jgi:homoserine kinase type II